MARRWSLFFRTVESFLNWRFRRLLIGFLLGILLTTGIAPVRSQSHSVQPAQLVQQGKAHYDAGQFQQAAADLQQAADQFQAQGDPLNQAATLSNLSLAYQQLGEWDAATGAIANSLQLLDINPSTPQLKILAPALNIYGRLQYLRSQPEDALESWQQATQLYGQLGDETGTLSSQINQLQALQSLGLYQQARATVEQIEQRLNQLPTTLQAQGWRSLGDVLRAVGALNDSQQFLEKSLALAQTNAPQETSATLLSLGNTYLAFGNLERDRQDSTSAAQFMPWRCTSRVLPDEALQFYQKAEQVYEQVDRAASVGIQAQLNRFSLLVKTGQLKTAQAVRNEINLASLSNNRTAVYARINYARNLACLRQQLDGSPNEWQEIDRLLDQAIAQARRLEDKSALSYALGNRGGLYEYLAWQRQNRSWLPKAQRLTSEALLLAQPSQAPSIAYQWQWQLGRLFEEQNQTQKAIAAYQAAVETLRSVRGDLLTINADVQFSFRDNVEPVYRQLVNLLLKTEAASQSKQENLALAVDLIDSLQLAELENFLRCNLSPGTPNVPGVNQIIANTAFIYPIILEDRVEVIFKLPQQPLGHTVSFVPRTEVETTLQTLRTAISRRNPETFRETSQQVYQWLIAPLAANLKQTEIETLVFALDGSLRNVPMAVLYDAQAEEYLVEKYALAVLPTSQLFDLQPSPGQLRILAAGISEALEVGDRQFGALDAQNELQQIENVASTQILLNSEFTPTNLQQQLNSGDFSVVHMATHGNFSSNPEETYVLAYDELLSPQQLDRLLTSRSQDARDIELLVLSACQTAAGDNRATLGLAGIAVRSGANSTLATLWRVSDQFTIRLIKEFYKELNNGATKAEALHHAQKALVYEQAGERTYQNDPYDWGPYVLVGNWQ